LRKSYEALSTEYKETKKEVGRLQGKLVDNSRTEIQGDNNIELLNKTKNRLNDVKEVNINLENEVYKLKNKLDK